MFKRRVLFKEVQAELCNLLHTGSGFWVKGSYEPCLPHRSLEGEGGNF